LSDLIDTHAHLCDPVFDGDRADVLSRARAEGVAGVIAVGETLDDARRNLDLASRHPGIYPAAGLYPTHVDAGLASTMESWIREHAGRLVGIGEVGLDRWKIQDEEERALQEEIFVGFIRLAAEVDLPINVHSRSASRRAVELLIEAGATRVQMHAFDGKASSALPAVEAGYFFSVPPSVVRSRQKQKLVRRLPLECLLLESDSPVLGPVPGVRNEPANVARVPDVVAEIKEVDPSRVVEAVRENTHRLYRLPRP
jgi:TatD DNase family protein